MNIKLQLSCLLLLAACTGQSPEQKKNDSALAAARADSIAAAAPPTATAPPQDTTTYPPGVFEWDTELCHFTGQYDTTRFTLNQLKNTFHLWYGWEQLQTDEVVFKPEDLPKLSLPKLETEYAEKHARIVSAELIHSTLWEQLRKLQLLELRQEYYARKITLIAQEHPEVLLQNYFTPYCRDYAEALASKDTAQLFRAWRKLVDEQKKHNGWPEHLEAEFNEQYHSPKMFPYARVDLMTFGWWNCVNAHVTHIELRTAMEKRFEQLFQSVHSECEEP